MDDAKVLRAPNVRSVSWVVLAGAACASLLYAELSFLITVTPERARIAGPSPAPHQAESEHRKMAALPQPPEPRQEKVVPVALTPADEQAVEEAKPATSGPAETGRASWYEIAANTASGEAMDASALTAAHRSLPLGTTVLVENLDNGRSVVVRINDRGPFTGNRIIDVSKAAAAELGMVADGVANVRVSPVAGAVAGAANAGVQEAGMAR
jgi:rare lipoprotein A